MKRLLPLLLLASPAVAQQAPTCTVTAEPDTLTGGGTVAVTWTVTNGATCLASGGWSGPKDCAGGTQTLVVSQPRTFILTVKAAKGKVTAKYTKPTQNTDGTPATITGFKLYIADAPSQLPDATPITLPVTPLEYVFWREPGDVTAGIKAVRDDGVDSAMSNTSSKTVVAASTTCQDAVAVNPRPKAPSFLLSWFKTLFSPLT